ncbi:MAG: tandem-95 repeat protein, partial [Sulfurovum sp.]|nr:tandem-95 repeat protein [Sulfurovum sp.]NNJ44858.1 tandem-95 repeat protein [Sulfurovum sp.]
EDTSVDISVLANDTDVDGNEATLFSATNGTNGTTSVNTTTGAVTYTPNADFNGTDTFTYTNSEGNSATVTVTVNAVNDAPVAVDDSPLSTDANIPINNIDVLDNDIDTDGDTLNIITAGATNGTVTINADGTLSYIPNTNYYGMDTVTYQISDGMGGTDSQTFTIEVIGTTILPTNQENDTPDTSTDNNEEDEAIQKELTQQDNLNYDIPDIVTDHLVDEEVEKENAEERVLIDVLESIEIDSLEYVLNIQDPSVDSSDSGKPDSNMAQQLLILEPIQMNSLIFDSISDSAQSKSLHADLEKMYQDIDESFEEQKHKNELTVEVATGISVSLTAGFVAWLLRSGTLIASLFATMPMWRNFDPVSILAESEKEEETSDETSLDNIEQLSPQDQKTEQIFDKEK